MNIPNTEFILKVMRLCARHGIQEDLLWDENLQLYFNCNDVFVPAADAEAISEEDYDLLESTCEDLAALGDGYAFIYAPNLFVSRKCNIRPMSRYLSNMAYKDAKKLFLQIPENPDGL